MMLITLMPWLGRVLAIVAILGGAAMFGWVKGEAHIQAQWNADKAASLAALQASQLREATASAKVVTQYVDRVKTITTKGQNIIHVIPKLIPVDACPAPAAVGVLLDAAASGTAVSDTPSPADAAPIALANLTASVATNYEACRLNAEQLTALQDWIRSEQAASK